MLQRHSLCLAHRPETVVLRKSLCARNLACTPGQTISTITMLKTWIELVHSAREAVRGVP